MHNAGRSDHQCCAECGTSRPDAWILHNVRHKSNYRLLCTHCLLSSFRGHFCHHCFDVFLPLDSPSAPRASQRVLCLHCPSISHLSCLNSGPNHPNSAAFSDQFHCPVCADPNFRFFRVDRAIKRDSMRAVIAAARIAAETVRKGAATARVEAEKRVREASIARKRAREALERVAYLSMKDMEKKCVAARDSWASNGMEGSEKKAKVASFGSVASVDTEIHCGSDSNGLSNGTMNPGSAATPQADIKPPPTSNMWHNEGK